MIMMRWLFCEWDLISSIWLSIMCLSDRKLVWVSCLVLVAGLWVP